MWNTMSSNCEIITKSITFYNEGTWKRRKKENVFEVRMAENFPKSMTDTKEQFQESEQTATMINIQSIILYTLWNIIFKLQKVKESGWGGKEYPSCKGTGTRVTSDFLSEAKKRVAGSIARWKKQNQQARTPYPVKVSIINEGEIVF